MTTIVWDGKHLYSDSQCTSGDYKGLMTKALTVRTPTGSVVVAMCGEVDQLSPVVAALKAGEDIAPMIKGTAEAIVVAKGVATIYVNRKSWTTDAPVFMGSGSGPARGAFHATKSAAKALAAAIAVDLYSCGPIVKLKA